MASKQELLRRQQMMKSKQDEGNNLYKEKTERLKVIFTNFQQNLQKFALEYKDEINKNPQFREKFSQLCDDIGIDPIVSRKTIFSQLGFGDFYNQLFMAILDICQRKRQINGGLIHIQELIQSYQNKYKNKITKNDVLKSIETVQILGTGCKIIKENYICTLPYELSDDSSEIVSMADQQGFVTLRLLKNWDTERFYLVIKQLLQQGLLWEDKKSKKNEILYFLPGNLSLFFEKKQNYDLYLK